MPPISPFVLNNFTGGLPLNYATVKNNNGFKNLKYGREGGYADSDSVDAFRVLGTIQPGPGFADLINPALIDGLPTKFVVYSNTGRVYCIAGNKVHEITISNDTITNNAGITFPVTINTAGGVHSGHTGHILSDIVLHELGGEVFLFVSWNDNVDGDIARIRLTNFSLIQNYLSGTVYNGITLGLYPHPMLVSEKSLLYVADGRNIHKIDNSSSPYLWVNDQQLDVGWVVLDIINYQGLMFIGASRFANETSLAKYTSDETAKPTKVYIWDYRHLSETTEIPIDDYLFRKFFIKNGVLYAVTSGSENSAKVWQFNGVNFERKQEIPRGCEPGGNVASYDDNRVVWMSREDGILQSYGAPLGFVSVYQRISKSGGNQGGGVVQADTNKWYIGLRDGANNFRVKRLDKTKYQASASLISLVAELPALSELQFLRAFWEPFVSSDNVNATITIYFNNQSESTNRTINYQADGAKGVKYFVLGKTKANNVQIKIDWPSLELTNTLAINRIEVGHRPVTKLL